MSALDSAAEAGRGGHEPLRVLDLFSGIGGFSLGLERTGGFRTVAFCEIDPFCRRVLAKHWPEVPCYDDVRTLTADRLRADGIAVDVICGGFPCQDLSVAGKGLGLEGKRSGLWSEIARLSGELRPRYIIVENVAALLGRGLDRVLGCLAALGYDAEWHCIPASAVGAPHRRDRFWLVADTECKRPAAGAACAASAAALHDIDRQHPGGPDRRAILQPGTVRACPNLADADERERQSGRPSGRMGWGQLASEDALFGGRGGAYWLAEPSVGRVANGFPGRVDRLRALGNAVVPQIPELIGRAILAARPASEAAIRSVRLLSAE